MAANLSSKPRAALTLIAIVAAVTLGFLYITRDTRAAIICTSLDDGIRPRNHCIMNPFRDRSPESAAEGVLRELKAGNVDSIGLLVDDSARDHFFSRELEYPVVSWRIGDRTQENDRLAIHYWVRRSNYYDLEESVGFFFVRTDDEWRIYRFTAVY